MVPIFNTAVFCVRGQIIAAQPRCPTLRLSEDNTTINCPIEYQVRASMPLAALVGYFLVRFVRPILGSSPAK